MSLQALRLRMSGITALAIVLVLAALAIGILLLGRQFLFDEAQTRLESDAAETAQGVSKGLPSTLLPQTGTFYLLWGPDGQVISAPAGIATAPFESAARAASDKPRIDVIQVAGSSMLVDSRLARDAAGRTVGVVQTASPLAPVTAAENRLIGSVVVGGGVALVLAILAAWLVAGRTTRPIEAALRRQRRFTADASHELRTPLTVIDASLQALRRHPGQTVGASLDTLDAAQGEVGRMIRMLDALLTLARGDLGSAANSPVSVDVDAVFDALRSELAPRATQTGHPLDVRTTAIGSGVIDADQLRQIILILVDNALVHTPSGTPVSVAASRTDSALLVDVTDRGPGIPATERQGVFDRFRRLGTSRPGGGSGLGLSIARELAQRAGGSIHLASAEPGVSARVSLPMANSGQSPND